ncbi:MAG: PGF-pre-PGF domain-containing protein [Candidatus Methanoperedens sp.]
MNNKALRSFLLFLVYVPVLMLVMLSPAYAITTTIKPYDVINGTNTDAYTATLDPTGGPLGGFFFLNITIPAGYILNLPPSGQTVGSYTMLNTTNGTNKVIINITSNTNSNDYFVNVRYSTDYGLTYSTSNNQNISNISIGASSLKITKPTSSSPGYINLSLGGAAGPISSTNNRITLTLANGTLTNPSTVGTYTWNLAAKNSPTGTPYNSSNDVHVASGASNTVVVPVLNASTPLNVSSGSLTVNITTTSGVNVTNLTITMRNFTSNPDPSFTNGAAGLSGILFIGIDAPALSGLNFTARISINYSSVLPLSIPEANLKIYRHNTTSNQWEALSNIIVDTTNKIVSGDTTAFSTFAIMGAAPAAAGGGGDGGGSGGGGVTSSEPFDNIAKSETYDTSLIANTSVTYTFKAPEIGIYEIAVTGKENENNIALRVEALKGTSKLVTASPPGTVYKNLNIWAGTNSIKEAIIRFKVNNSWLDSNKAASSDISMLKWDVDKWVQLETSETAKDSTSTSYEVKTDSFSVFAISNLKGVEVPTAVQTPLESVTTTVTPVNTIVPEATKKTPGFDAIITIIAIALLVSFIKKRR